MKSTRTPDSYMFTRLVISFLDWQYKLWGLRVWASTTTYSADSLRFWYWFERPYTCTEHYFYDVIRVKKKGQDKGKKEGSPKGFHYVLLMISSLPGVQKGDGWDQRVYVDSGELLMYRSSIGISCGVCKYLAHFD